MRDKIVRHPNIDMKRRFLGYDFGGPSFKKVFGKVLGQRIGHHQPEPSLRRLIVLYIPMAQQNFLHQQ